MDNKSMEEVAKDWERTFKNADKRILFALLNMGEKNYSDKLTQEEKDNLFNEEYSIKLKEQGLSDEEIKEVISHRKVRTGINNSLR